MRPRTTTSIGLFALAVMLSAAVVLSAGCGKDNRHLGTYVWKGSFSTQNGEFPYVSKLVLAKGDTWQLIDPITNADGSTTPHAWSGTYTVHGNTVSLNVKGLGLFSTGVVAGDKITMQESGLVYVKQ